MVRETKKPFQSQCSIACLDIRTGICYSKKGGEDYRTIAFDLKQFHRFMMAHNSKVRHQRIYTHFSKKEGDCFEEDQHSRKVSDATDDFRA